MTLVPIKEQKRSTSRQHQVRQADQRRSSKPRRTFAPSVANATRAQVTWAEMQMEMHSSIDLADPMSREGSGTSWLPDSSPMYGKMFMFGDDMLMLHGAIFPRYTNVSTRRGDDRIDAPNWFMAHVFASARRQRADRRALDDEPRSAHRRRTRLSASVSNRRIVARPAIA